ncbi:GGDEF domain-containing protein [Desulfospira joergensenii]|uniref:GGDEF domain-containing protein n=1 Tax=Desulfospira joergensenii TaxID=53329 RepID=UPI0003B34559|nr:GGDEF domain-containing protein [Desulfospira joergensenii]
MIKFIKGRFFSLKPDSRMNLKPSFMLLTAMLFIASAAAVSWSVRTLAEGIIEEWAPRFITKQALYDKSRTIQPILREVALSRQLATSQFIRDWARRPDDPNLTKKALMELETYRQNFQDQSYFVAFLSNGRYYHNNAANEYAGKEYRYTLDPENKADSWFYDLIRQKRDIHINVNPDIELGITKLWIDILIRDGNDILGMAGTGFDLTEFLNNVVEESEPGITSLFVDHSGAIQLHRDKRLIDFSSISKKEGTHKTLDLIFSKTEDKTAVYAAMKELESGKKKVATTFVDVSGHRHLAGIVYLPEIDWHEITLIDLDIVLPISYFSTILLVYIVTLLIALVLFNFALNRLVLNPLSQLDQAMGQIEKGRNPAGQIQKGARGEVGRLISRFMQMAQTVLASRRDLEKKVQDRTAALERLAQVDPLTELLNRRGMTERLKAGINRAQREKSQLGLLWLDIDWFKEINDTHGHAVGDEALKAVAKIIQATIRSYDLAARWGGDEFLVLLQPADSDTLARLGNRLCSVVAAHPFDQKEFSLTVSVGGCISMEGQKPDSLLQKADQALYEAKASGRNCFRAYTHSS